jgi:hypothetical protein
VPFNYYRRLSAAQKRIYRQSDQIESVPLTDPMSLHPLTTHLTAALSIGDRAGTQRHSRQLVTAVTEQLNTAPVRVRVLARRPSNDWGELHGLYEPAEENAGAKITVWMRTAKRRQVVAFRTYLRTLLHELCHHLDYEHLKFADSFHTEGFYKRESSLFYALTQSPTTPLQTQLDL